MSTSPLPLLSPQELAQGPATLCIGVDEAGRGCLAGPVVAACVWLPATLPPELARVDDSKKIAEPLRRDLALAIRQHALAFGVGYSWPREIDAVNILNATFRAMSRACLALYAQVRHQSPAFHQGSAGTVLPSAHTLPLAIDGNKTIAAPHWRACSALPLPVQAAYVDGDARFVPIAAASILAKTVRDALMARLAERFPVYGLAAHKGYGTKAHIAAISAHGPCRLHRLTFRKVKPE
ncbi:ribonuclease HII [Desulfovibrio cuneatus]|uniref:ribonuclease HII n=1 Tax=Desulfovibrio cuneatus TaxID=159728 RepID=UPI0003FFF9F1|nr:ribonuclease HII [Desulfovibrio cuneatus]